MPTMPQAMFLLVMRDNTIGLDWSDAINAARAQGGSYRTVTACLRRLWIVERTGDHLLMLTYLGFRALEQAENREFKRRIYATR